LANSLRSAELVNDFRRPQITKTASLRIPNQYTRALEIEFRDYAFNEERAPQNQGLWREKIFRTEPEKNLDLEIGTGQGLHFQERARKFPERCIVGLELKYRPLVQSIRPLVRDQIQNARICRAHAFDLDLIFAKDEVDDIFIHFPDPWVTPRKPKNRMVNERMVQIFFDLQKSGSQFELKTDSREFFDWSLEHMKNSKYIPLVQDFDWHRNPLSEGRLRTQFEKIFASKQLPIHYALWKRP
jgi:tRNA (guanine-N7-)-methyltransferase